MAEARYDTLLTKLRKAFVGTGTGYNKLKAGYVYENGTYVKVWSGATKVYYYDGNTLLGMEEVAEGEDVLHPSVSTSKEGYTLYGWTNENGSEERVTTLKASGEEMTLYALYTSNTPITIATGSITGAAYEPNYTPGTKNTNYITGDIGDKVSLYYNVGTNTKTFAFTLNKKRYGKAQVVFCKGTQGNGVSKLDNQTFSNNSVFENIASGTHTFTLTIENDYASTWAINASGIKSLVLSEPIAWE